MLAATAPKPALRFWLIPSALSARVEIEPGVHVITEVSESGSFDSDGPDDEELAHRIAGALYFGDLPGAGYQGDDASLTASQAAADAAWDAEQERAGLAPEIVPAWLSTLRAVGCL